MPSDHTAVALGDAALATLPDAVPAPGYDRGRLRPSIVHIGVGGFHRAHLATYVHELCQLGLTDWAIVGAGVLPADASMSEALDAQDHLYTLITRGSSSTEVAVIGSIVDYIHASPVADELIDRIAADDTQIVSLTVTEGGYPVDDATGRFLPDSPGAGPASAFGIIAAALDRRRRGHGAPLTVMSCDNVMSNGAVTRAATLGEARRVSEELAAWVDEHVTFPNSMVDRITPTTTAADRAWLVETHGVIDRWPVVTEPFRQWVVEDAFAGDRPPLERLDVIVTDDVAPYELMKLRLLNAAHSCLAYLAWLDGFVTVDAALADRHLRKFVLDFLEREAKPVLPAVAGIDLDQYTTSLIERFANPQIGDQIARLCLDGSAKFPKFLLPTVRAQLGVGGPVELSALALAGWCEYLARGAGTDGLAADPLLDRAVEWALRSVDEPTAFLAFDDVFPDDIATNPIFAGAFERALTRLRADGLRSAVAHTMNGTGRRSGGR
ncbi:MAG: mannitol dehydrogenase family protein [Ilumatobacter sp.]|uniref:mannitol dehydrogenase family protein n=1 Tax=Ilumatobacter sp. TaxID=1967498 RepID=UPI0026316EC2|nr:mannitol dehydrogenase family protein [Ilumatobacter sp.]MDJ0769612.1 mannitol dehydrogenase family protein [Ilumatobacter sp.]